MSRVNKENGGFVQLPDAFEDKSSSRIIAGTDLVSDFVLDNTQIPDEKNDYIELFLAGIPERFSQPIGILQDLGRKS